MSRLQGRLMARLEVMCAIAFKSALEDTVFPAFSRRTGHELSVRWDPTKLLVKAIAGGERADLAILTNEAMIDLADAGVIDRGTITRLADAVLGLAVKRGRTRPDISTATKFRQAIFDARSIAFSESGASGLYFAKLIDSLGIGDAVRRSAVIVPTGFTAERLLNDEAELAVQQISELVAVDGVEVVGAFPPEYQQATQFSAAQFAGRHTPAAHLLLSELSSPASKDAYRLKGLLSD
jgi:molybdate transport system substrate-binding protein